MVIFFFSSRRRHTRSYGDWSSDVCSSDLPELGVELVERAAGWDVPRGPVLGDHAYGENTWLRDSLDRAGCQYVLSVGPDTKVFEHGTSFALPTKKPGAT